MPEQKVETERIEHPIDYYDPHRAALEDNPDRPEKLTWSVILSVLFLGFAFTGPIIFGFICVTPILVQLGLELGGSALTSWIPSGWGLAAGIGFTIAGSLSDCFGRRYVILTGQIMTIIGGIVAATAQTMNQLIAGEVILGASIGTVSVAYSGISEILPNKYRGFGLAWTELNLAPWAVGSSLLAHQLVTYSSWRVLFYLAIGYATVSFIGTAAFYFPPSHPRADGRTNWQLFKDLDFVGFFLFISGLTVFLVGLNFGGNTFPWGSAQTLVPLILGFAVFISAFIYDFTVPVNPLFPWALFRRVREFTNLLVLVFVAGMVFFAASALNAETILYLYTSDPVQIGIWGIPSGVSQLIGGVFVPAFVAQIKHVHWQLTFGVALQTIFFGLAATITPNNINWVMASQFFSMFAFGWITLNCYTTASLHVPQKDLGIAIGQIGTWRSIGGSVGSVIFASIFTQVAASSITERITEIVQQANLPLSLVPKLMVGVEDYIVGIPGALADVNAPQSVIDSAVTAARYGYAYGFRITWLVSIPFGVVALVAAVMVRDPSKYFTNHVAIHLEKQVV